MKPIGKIPSPYGPMIDVFHDPERHSDPDLCYFHDMNGCMDMAGVHGAERRASCFREFKARQAGSAVTFDIFLKHGGRRVSHIPLTRPAVPLYPNLPKTQGMDIPLENWVTLVMDAAHWHERAKLLQKPIRLVFDAPKEWRTPEDARQIVVGLGVCHLLTAALEHLHEKEIDCIQAAAFYALTIHDEWSTAGLNWLMPIKDTWFADWLKDHPSYVEFARACRLAAPSLPAWIAGDRT